MPKIIKDTVYLAVRIGDEYEFPFAVAVSQKEIAELLKMKVQTVRYGILRQNGIFAKKGIKIEAVRI